MTIYLVIGPAKGKKERKVTLIAFWGREANVKHVFITGLCHVRIPFKGI